MTSYVGGATAVSTGNTDVSVPLTALTGGSDSAPVEGDLVLFAYNIADADNVDLNLACNTAGFTEITDLFADGVREANLGVYWKFMTATPDTAVVGEGSLGDIDTSIQGVVQVFRGVKPVASGGPFDVAATTDTNTASGHPDPPSIDTTGTAGIWTVIVGANAHSGDADGSFTAPTGYATNFLTIGNQDSSDGIIGMGYRTDPSDPEDPGVMTASHTTDAAWAAVTMALAPAVVPEINGSGAATLAAVRASGFGFDPTAIFPDRLIEIAFSTNPGDTPVWDDVSAFVKKFDTDRGTEHELDQMQSGTASVTLDNSDRRFDPTNDASPYWPGVLPMRRIRIRAAWHGVAYPVFDGYIEEWPQEYLDNDTTPVVTIRASDGFLPLAGTKVSATYSEEGSGTRIDNILDDLGWPAGDRDIDAGNSTIAALTLDDEPALSHMLDIATAELGLLFMARDGTVRFIGRQNFLLTEIDEVNRTWGDVPGEHRYVDVVPQFDFTQIFNDVRITPEGGAEQVAQDATSAETYGLSPENFRTLTRSVPLASESEALDQANYLLSRYKDPAVRIDSMELAVLRDPDQWADVLDREIGDRVLVRRRPASGGDPIERQVYIVGIAIAADGETGVWSVTWRLAPFDADAGFWILGDADRSLLGETTKLGV